MSKYIHFKDRIASERARLDMNQTDFSKKLSISRRTLSSYEAGDSVPDIASLLEWKQVLPDLDIIFILMGIPEKLKVNLNLLGLASDIAGKMNLPEDAQSTLQELLFYQFSASNLNDAKVNKDEQALLLAYRAATSDTKKAICRILDIEE